MSKTDKDSGNNGQARSQLQQTQQQLAEVNVEQRMRMTLGAMLSLMSELSKH